ncbi:blood vessel epicardial substance-like isoform X2 [Eriocheir sinensis]|uniref:blood vessel epicardial substance-like isoform X2 n=1 Tax=Eriocheir sinensis TaxID=95602 RepID=UPI0021C87D30|nr:blood vessel epicardial substance-like isoform X2 [Eriocheir sinensis]
MAAAAVGGGEWWQGEGDGLSANLTVLAAAQHGTAGGALEGTDLAWAEGYNDSLSTPATPMPLGNTTAAPSRGTPKKIEYCTEWPGASLMLFQVANFICLLAFLVPHNFRLSGLVMRSVLSVGVLLFTLWAGLDLCAIDILAWNLSFLLVNGAHVLYLTYSVWPPRVHPDLLDLYDKVFRPLKVNRQNFRHLVREAKVLWLEAGETYALEDITPADERLSILLTGKLRVTCDSTHLHYILPNQFIDSPEWEACPDDSDELFQVTIVAEEKSKYLRWNRARLRQVLRLRPFLHAIIHNLVGKDITTKLYSLNEQLGVGGAGAGEGARGGVGAQDVWRGVVQRSMSLDTVHTGTKGFVRSLAWRASHRRTSATYCDSLRSSPGRSGDESNSSDPTLHGQPSPRPHRDLQELRGLQGAGLLGSEQFGRPHRQLQQQPPLPPGGLAVGSRKGQRDNVVRFHGIPNT